MCSLSLFTIFFTHFLLIFIQIQSFLCSPNDVDTYNRPYMDKSPDIVDPVPFPPGWIDPYDMMGDKRHNSPPSTLTTIGDVTTKKLNDRLHFCELHWKRLINTLMKAIEIEDHESYSQKTQQSVHNIKLDYLLFEHDYKLLKRFVNNGGTGESIREISDTLIKIFSQINIQNEFSKSEMSLKSVISGLKRASVKLITSPEWLVVTSVLLLLITTLWFVFVTHSYRFGMFTALLTVFFSGFGFTWMRMYEEKEAEKFAHLIIHGQQAPYHCRGLDMPWYQFLFYKAFGTDCYEFFKIREVRAIVKVSPTEVLSETLSSLIISPLKNAGAGYSAFILGVMVNLPWYLKPIAIPFCFLVPLVFVLIIIMFLCDYKLSIGITGIHLMPSWGARRCDSCVGDSKYVEDISHKNKETGSADGSMISLHVNQLRKLLGNDVLTENVLNKKPEHDCSQNKKEGDSLDDGKSNEREINQRDHSSQDSPMKSIKDKVVEEKSPTDLQNQEVKKRTKSIYTISNPDPDSSCSNTNVDQGSDCVTSDATKSSNQKEHEDFKTK